MSLSITTIVSMKTLGASVSVAGTMTIAGISRPLAITVSISITSIVSMKTLGASVGVAGGMAIAISWLGISRPLAIAIPTISITTIVSMQTLWASVCVAAASIRMVGNTSIAGLGSSEAGKGYNNCYNLSCHGYKCTKLSQ